MVWVLVFVVINLSRVRLEYILFPKSNIMSFLVIRELGMLPVVLVELVLAFHTFPDCQDPTHISSKCGAYYSFFPSAAGPVKTRLEVSFAFS